MKDDLHEQALGYKKAEIVFKNAQILNVFSGEIEKGDIAVSQGKILGCGSDYLGEQEIDCKGKYICPGLIDGHVHIESSLMTPGGFAQVIIPKGTTTVIADPHEIANVCGLEGIEYMLRAAEKTPLNVHIMLPSCVPCMPSENSGAKLTAKDLMQLKDNKGVLGLGEMMDYPGVINNSLEVHQKLQTFSDGVIDGHAPGLSDKELNAYILSGVKTDHECVTPQEVREKVSKGMYIHLRQGSATRNVKDLCPAVTPWNHRRLLFCTDDKHPTDILREGHIDYNIRLAMEEGIDLMVALRMATLNIAECYGLKTKGAIGPGYDADLLILDSLDPFSVSQVYIGGVKVADEGKGLFSQEKIEDTHVNNTVRLKSMDINFDIALRSNKAKVISMIPQNILTKENIRIVATNKSFVDLSQEDDLLKLAVIERHKGSGNIGLGLVEGYGLKGGAIGLTIAHDSHNMILIGDDEEAMRLAATSLENMQGGIVVIEKGEVVESLTLEIAGLMTDQPFNEVIDAFSRIEKKARQMGVKEGIDPILNLAFLALPVVPELKLTDRGLFDVVSMKVTSIEP